MTIRFPSPLILLTFFILQSSTVQAQSLQNEYVSLIARRVELEKRAADLSGVLRTLESKTLTIEESWKRCANGRWRFVWNTAVASANESRDALEAQRSRLFDLNRTLNARNFELEMQRRQIEHDHPAKNFDYEAAFRKYMHLLENDYLLVLEGEYFHAFEKYLSGVKSYHVFIEHAQRACENNDVAPVAVEEGLRYVNEIVAVVKTIKSVLKGT